MERNIKNITLFIVVLFITSCSGDFLELYPETTLNEGNFYGSETEYILLANGCYVPMRNYEKGTHWIIAELISDNLGIQHCTTSGEPTRGAVDQFLLEANNAAYADFWNASYQGITRCNKLLLELERSTIKWSSESVKNRSAGEVLFLRALYYFNLVRQFGGVPLVTAPIAAQDAVNIKRASENAVYEQITIDLKEAVVQLKNAVDSEEKGRVNETAAQALLGKVYLTLKNYGEAAKIYKEIIDAGKFRLLDDYADIFNPSGKDFTETIFSIQYSENTDELSQQFIFNYAPITSGGAVTLRPNVNINVAGKARPTEDLITAFEAGDKRKEVSIQFWNGPDWDNTVYDIPYCAKYKPPISSPTNRCGDNFPIIRFSDVLLSYAESLNELGQTDAAVSYVTQVRTRAGLPTLPSYEQTQLRQLIENERQVEFCFENHRWYDLKRTGRALDVLKEHGIREKQRKSFIYETAFQMDSYKLLAPIPAEQILINGIEQNPKY
jgi:tetratricopeptide (TPR) repeat protein